MVNGIKLLALRDYGFVPCDDNWVQIIADDHWYRYSYDYISKHTVNELIQSYERQIEMGCVNYFTGGQTMEGNSIRGTLAIAMKRHMKGDKLKLVSVAINRPEDAVELIANTEKLVDKLTYYMQNYDDEMRLKHMKSIRIIAVMCVHESELWQAMIIRYIYKDELLAYFHAHIGQLPFVDEIVKLGDEWYRVTQRAFYPVENEVAICLYRVPKKNP